MQNFDNEKMKNLLDTYINRLYNMHKKTKDLLQRFERINTNIWRVVDDFEKLKISIKKISTNKDCKKVTESILKLEKFTNSFLIDTIISNTNEYINEYSITKKEILYNKICSIIDDIILKIKEDIVEDDFLSEVYDINIYTSKIYKAYYKGKLFENEENIEILKKLILHDYDFLSEDTLNKLIEYIYFVYNDTKRKKDEINKNNNIKHDTNESINHLHEKQINNINEENNKKKNIDIFTDEENEFIVSVNDIIYKNKENTKYINEYHEKIIKYKYDELKKLDINISYEDYIKFKKDVLTLRIQSILEKINEIKSVSWKYEENSEELNFLIKQKEIYLNLLNNLYIEYESIIINVNKDDKIIEKNNLIYLFINDNNTSFENAKIMDGIKSSPQEYYLSYLNLIEVLENNPGRKSEKYTSNSRKSGLYKVKNFKTRIVYLPLNENNILVIMSIYKKNTNDKYERELIDRIYNDNIDQINKIKSLLFDENKKYKLIEENRNITNQIKNYLKTYARGKKMK